MSSVISVEHLSKSYHLGQIGTGTLSHDLNVWWAKRRGKPNPFLKVGESDTGKWDKETIWALDDVNFIVEQGEILGIIGRNGAGKSTLLKILSEVTAPSSGKVRVKGRIASLLEIGTGFHPELTGRENIFLNGAIMGMNRKEISRKFDEIVNFSSVEKFIDTPVKRYSSGMYVRLAFAVAAHLEAEILVIDEVLAVGDAEFQKKCLGKMGDVAGEGRTVLFVSHNMAAIKSLCSRCIWLNNGILQKLGTTEDVVSKYSEPASIAITDFRPVNPLQGRGIELIEAELLPKGKTPNNGQELIFRTRVRLLDRMRFSVHMFVHRESDLVMIASDYHSPVATTTLDTGQYIVEFTIPPYLLNPGNHRIGVVFSDYSGNVEQCLIAHEIISFDLEDDGYRRNGRYHRGWSGSVSPLLSVSMEKTNNE